MGRVGSFLRRDKPYRPLKIFVLDPLEYTAMGLAILKGPNGEKRWADCKKAKWKHPDPQKTACVHNGAIIYTMLFPDRQAPDMRPPEAWKREVGITEATLWDARKQLELEDPDWSAKMGVRKAVNDAMDAALPEIIVNDEVISI